MGAAADRRGHRVRDAVHHRVRPREGERPVVEDGARLVADGQGAHLVGQIIGNYKVIEPLGAGGMGEVYLASDTRTGRPVALKILLTYLTTDAERVRRFQQEARAVLALNHPNIVTIYEIGQTEGLNFIVTSTSP